MIPLEGISATAAEEPRRKKLLKLTDERK